jgi:Flp pilus assembly protein TadD
MSLLFRALAKASETAEATAGAGGASGATVAVAAGGSARPSFLRRPPVLRAILTSIMAVFLGLLISMMWFGEELIPLFDELLAVIEGEPPRPVAKTSRPTGPRQSAPRPQIQAQKPAESGAGPVASSPVPELAKPEIKPEVVVPPVVTKSAGPEIATLPPAEPYEPKKRELPIKPAPEAAKAEPTAAPVAPTKQAKAPAKAAPKAIVETPKVPLVISEGSTDLPNILDNIRQQDRKTALKPPVNIARTGDSAAAKPSAAATAITDSLTVQTSSAKTRDELNNAYNSLVRGQYELAFALYSSLLEREPRLVQALIGRGASSHKLGRIPTARADYERALEYEPGNREALTNLLAILAGETPREALFQLRQLQKNNPIFSPIPAQMAGIHAQLGEYSEAIALQNAALSLTPENSLYRFNLAVIQDKAGMFNEAINSYENVMAMRASGQSSLPLPDEHIRERVKYLKTR